LQEFNMVRSFVTACWLVLAAFASVGDAADAPKYNVLFLAVDDLRPELGCYGNRLVQTPQIDALASTGVRFERAYCQFPLCNPSRTSMLTGRHPTTTGVLDNTLYFRNAHPEWVSLPQHFQASGYVTARTGKIFHGGIDDTAAWTIGGEERRAAKTRPKQNPANSDRIVKLEGDGEMHGDYRTATRAVELLEELQAKPFFLAVGFTKPHSPPTAPARLFELYDPAKSPLPPDFAALPTVPAGFPEASVPPRSGDLFIGREASAQAAREMISAYYASLTFTDVQVGRVLAALDRLKLRDRTIIVLFGDHGYHLGEKGKWSKHGSLFEVAARVPLIVCLPGAAAGKSSPRTVQLLDVYPTLVELCGLPAMSGLEGQSVAPLLKDPQAAWPHPAYIVCKSGPAFGRSVRTERWRYSDWDEGAAGAVLFDEVADPHETKNLAGDPAFQETVAELKALLDKLPPRS
jgi:arylsulfatase A-like enzyme